MTEIRVLNNADSLRNFLNSDSPRQQVGFVPTMGALHHGHLSLIDRSIKENDITVVSIFVNPKQFNNQEDLIKYPRTLERDVKMLEPYGSQIVVYYPEVEDVYPEGYQLKNIDLGIMGNVLEGRFRPGHFDGVVEVVSRFFEIIEPNRAYFGEKDFQQLAVIKFMTSYLGMNIDIIGCETFRESSGLASSSRNYRLNEQELEESVIIYRSLMKAKSMAENYSIQEVKDFVSNSFRESPLELEYFDVVDPITFEALNEWSAGARGCIAAFAGEVRLIDNMQLL